MSPEEWEAEFQASLSSEELAGYQAWNEALDRFDEGIEKVDDRAHCFCNKPVGGCGECILWPNHRGNCTLYMGP